MQSAVLSVPACSFKRRQHPEYAAIEAECAPWVLALAAAPTAAAARFWQDQSLPLLGSFLFAHCAKKRAILATKMLTWFTVSDTSDDDLAVRGSAVTDHVQRRHDLILACFAGKPGLQADVLALAAQSHAGGVSITREFSFLQDIWHEISNDMPLTMQSRYQDAVGRYLHALRVQAQYRSADSLPGVDEYLNVVRRPASIVLQLLILLEYGLGIELDQETLESELVLRLHHAVVGHVALYNDLFSHEAEIASGDFFNLPSVILQEGMATRPGFTFAHAVKEAVKMTEEVDKLSAQLIQEAEESSLVRKPGVAAYLRALGSFMAGNVEWSSKTARYTNTCSAEGLVLPVERTLTLPSAPLTPPRTTFRCQSLIRVQHHRMGSIVGVHVPRLALFTSPRLHTFSHPVIYR